MFLGEQDYQFWDEGCRNRSLREKLSHLDLMPATPAKAPFFDGG